MQKLNIHDFKIPPGQEEISTNFYNEIWNDGEYDRFGVGVREGDTVLDCGSNIGLFTGYALYKGASKVYAYEADELTHQYFIQNFSNSKFSNVKSEHRKIGNFNDCLSLSGIFEETGEKKFDFAKIDIEYAEYEFLIYASPSDIQRVDRWAIEFHLWGYHNNDATELKMLMQIIEKFNLCGFNTYLQQIHVGWNLIMFYAEKRGI